MTKRNDQIIEYLWDLITFIHRDQNFGQSTELSVIQDDGLVIRIKSMAKINFRDTMRQNPDHYLPGLSLEKSVCIEMGVWELQFANEDDRLKLEISNYEFVEDVASSKTVLWDNAALTADDIENLLSGVDPEVEASLLLETFGNLGSVNFDLYPNVLRPYLRKWIESSDAQQG